MSPWVLRLVTCSSGKLSSASSLRRDLQRLEGRERIWRLHNRKIRNSSDNLFGLKSLWSDNTSYLRPKEIWTILTPSEKVRLTPDCGLHLREVWTKTSRDVGTDAWCKVRQPEQSKCWWKSASKLFVARKRWHVKSLLSSETKKRSLLFQTALFSLILSASVSYKCRETGTKKKHWQHNKR